MKKIKITIAVFFAIAVLLASLGALAACNLDVSHDIFTGKVTVMAKFDKSKNESVSLQIVPLDTDIKAMSDVSYGLSESVYLNQKKIDSNGNVVFVVPFSGKSGKYIVRVHSATNIGEASEKLLKYFSMEDITNAWDNLVTSPEENLDYIIDVYGCTDDIILSLKNDKSLFEYISQYEEIGEFNPENLEALFVKIKSDCENINTFRNAVSVIKNADNVSEIKAVLKNDANVEAFGISDIIDRYNNLKNTRPVDSKLIGKDFDSSNEFRKVFLEALEDAEDAEDDKPSKTNSNGKGTGSTSSLGTSINVPAVTVVPDENPLPFKDIDNVPWAKDAIADLYANGIINGKSETVFAPNDYILREEFVKMIVNLLEVEVADVTTSFADVDSNAWYAPYIAASQKAGFINGYSDTVFGVGNYITRQDVAVILSRIANLSDSTNSVAFSDDADISDYAKDAVKILSSNGIITGSDGAFMPNNNSTRAETAVMIYRLAQKIKEGV